MPILDRRGANASHKSYPSKAKLHSVAAMGSALPPSIHIFGAKAPANLKTRI